ncbi:hypothetical protein R3P38DRAFT_3000476, partial [Favolaschia claudopus]
VLKPLFVDTMRRTGACGLDAVLVEDRTDQQVMATIQSRFTVAVPELPDHIDRIS